MSGSNTMPKTAPPALMTLSRFIDQQRSSRYIPCGLPRYLDDPIPPTLLHDVFNQFLHDCGTDIVPGQTDVMAFTDDLVEVLSTIYSAEDDRTTAIQKAFEKHDLCDGTRYCTGGEIQTDGHCYVIVECKHESTAAFTVPYAQAIQCYVELTGKHATQIRSSFPCFLVCITGSTMYISAAAWNARPTAQPLSTPIAFHFHSSDSESLETATRHIAALHKAAKSLKAYYSELESHCCTPGTVLHAQLFPYPTSYISPWTKKRIDLQYAGHMVNQNLVFLATEQDSNDEICVKFVQSYSEAAHKCLQELGHAPTLRASQKLAGGGWTMVVRDNLKEFETLYRHAKKRRLPDTVFQDIARTLTHFHDAGFVHGDVRDVNIMVSNLKKGQMEFMFIDFDWAGRADDARYPDRVNIWDIVRPEGVCRGERITKAHDVFMLDRLNPAR